MTRTAAVQHAIDHSRSEALVEDLRAALLAVTFTDSINLTALACVLKARDGRREAA